MTPEMFATRLRLRDDFQFYAPAALKIRTKKLEIVPFTINEAQVRLHRAIEKQLEDLKRTRVIILKARQMGLSTYVGGRMFWKVSQSTGRKALVVTHKSDSTRALFDMTKRFYDQCPAILKPETKYSSRKELSFPNLDSSYMVATAGGDGIARGETITDAHLSELAFWQKSVAEENYSGLMQSIPSTDGTFVAIESTAFGVSGLYADQWQQAVRGASDFIPVFLPWFIDQSYTAPVPEDFERSPEEIELVAEFGIHDGQLVYRRKKIAEIGPERFQQEYPATADEAFLTSGRPVFIPAQITRLLEARRNVKPHCLMALEGETWRKHPRGELALFHPIDDGETYYIGADVGAGVKRDWSVAQVLDSRGRQVATFRAQVDPDYFATILLHLGKLYGDAKIIVESNNHGILTCARLAKDYAYPNFFTEVIYDKVEDSETIRLGFNTNSRSKPLIIDKLRASMRNIDLEINDVPTLEEMRSFIVSETGKMEAEQGLHDDCVMALALVNFIHEGAYTPILNQDDWYVSNE